MLDRGYYLARRGFSLSLALAPADFDGFEAAADDYCRRHEGLLRSLSASP